MFSMYCIFRYIRVSKFLAQVHMRPKAHPVCLKAQRFVVILSAHNKRRVFTDSKDVLGYFYLYDQNDGDLRASERTGACLAANALPHKHFNSAHFSRLTSY